MDSDVEINSVTFGIEQATIEDIQVNVNLYLDGDGCPASGFGSTAELIAGETIFVGTADAGTMKTVNFAPGAVFTAGSSLIVEIEAPADGMQDPLHAFRSGANELGQCRANYLRAAQCGNVDWTDMAALAGGDFADTALVMSVGMSCVVSCGNCPTDANDDGQIGPFDLAALLAAWGPCKAGDPCECLDANSDAVIGPFDLAALLAAWGPCL